MPEVDAERGGLSDSAKKILLSRSLKLTLVALMTLSLLGTILVSVRDTPGLSEDSPGLVRSNDRVLSKEKDWLLVAKWQPAMVKKAQSKDKPESWLLIGSLKGKKADGNT